MSSTLFEICIIVLLILMNGFFSMSEMALVSSRKTKLKHEADLGKRGYKLAYRISTNPSQFLATIQTGITLITVVSGTFAGTTIAVALKEQYSLFESIKPYAEFLGTGTVVISITFFSIIFGELIPKRIALSHPEQIASKIVIPLNMFSLLFLPVIKFLTIVTELFFLILRIKNKNDPAVSKDEIAVLMEQGKSFGLFHEREQEMVERVLLLRNRKPLSFMTPRRDIPFFNLGKSDDDLIKLILSTKEDFIPAGTKNLDGMTGVINVQQVLRSLALGKRTNLSRFMEDPLYVPQSMNALSVLSKFQSTKMTCAFIIDEYGGVLGRISINDVLEEAVGATSIESDMPKIIERADKSYLVDGNYLIDDFFNFFDCNSKHDDFDFHTVAGLVMMLLDKIPAESDIITYEHLIIEVLDMDGKRVDKVMVKQTEKKDAADLMDQMI